MFLISSFDIDFIEKIEEKKPILDFSYQHKKCSQQTFVEISAAAALFTLQ